MKKCTKYEALFTFSDEAKLLEHIKVCPDCRKEHEKMQKVSELLQEAKPYFKEERKKFAKIKLACTTCVMFLCITTLGIVNFNTDISDTIQYGAVLSAQDLGLPVDSYGLLMVE